MHPFLKQTNISEHLYEAICEYVFNIIVISSFKFDLSHFENSSIYSYFIFVNSSSIIIIFLFNIIALINSI